MFYLNITENSGKFPKFYVTFNRKVNNNLVFLRTYPFLSTDSNRDNPFHSKKSPNMGSKWFIYEEMIQMGRHSYAKCMTAVSPLTVALVCAKPSDNEITMPASDGEDLNLDSAAKLKIDEWIDFETIAMTAKVVSFLRDQLHRLFNRQIHNLCSKSVRPPLDSETDNQLIDTIVSVLDREELHTGFAQFHELVLRPQLQQRVNQFVPKYQVRLTLLIIQYTIRSLFRAISTSVVVCIATNAENSNQNHSLDKDLIKISDYFFHLYKNYKFI